MENMEQRICEILVQTNKKTKTNLNSSKLISDGILDSLDIMNLIMALESEFDIEIDPEDVLSESFESVNAIAALVEKCKN